GRVSFMDSLRTDRDPSTWSVRTSNEQSIVLSTGVAAGPGSLSARPVAVRTDLVIMVVVHLDQSPFLADPRAHWTPLDRKSTRLNSSHQIISYAVFCLKKKKK